MHEFQEREYIGIEMKSNQKQKPKKHPRHGQQDESKGGEIKSGVQGGQVLRVVEAAKGWNRLMN